MSFWRKLWNIEQNYGIPHKSQVCKGGCDTTFLCVKLVFFKKSCVDFDLRKKAYGEKNDTTCCLSEEIMRLLRLMKACQTSKRRMKACQILSSKLPKNLRASRAITVTIRLICAQCMSINGPKLLFMNVLVIYLCFYGLKVAKDVIGCFQSTYEISKTLSNLAQKDEKH